MRYLPSLYKARVPTKQHVCGICLDRTRGKTVKVEFGYGVHVWLCEGHASVEFLTGRSGRDAVLTLMGMWQAQGCYTQARRKALDAHIAGLKAKPRHRPGSYAWPAVRARAERWFAAGEATAPVADRIREGAYGDSTAPSLRTIRRWRSDRRWLIAAPRDG